MAYTVQSILLLEIIVLFLFKGDLGTYFLVHVTAHWWEACVVNASLAKVSTRYSIRAISLIIEVFAETMRQQECKECFRDVLFKLSFKFMQTHLHSSLLPLQSHLA